MTEEVMSTREADQVAGAILYKDEIDQQLAKTDLKAVVSNKKATVAEAAVKQLAKEVKTVTEQVKKIEEAPAPKITSTTKRMIVIGIMTCGIIVSVGWAGGIIGAKDALIILSGIMNGGFALVKT